MAANPQQQAALDRAHAVKAARSRLKALIDQDRDLGVELVRSLISDPGAADHLKELAAPIGFCQSMRAIDLLMAIRGIGRHKAARAMRVKYPIPADRRLSNLTTADRKALRAWLKQWLTNVNNPNRYTR